ncbi:MAG: U32 family peptidase [Bacteroidaceae bacterium]|nr:U32 family peptidase [Bacteroidaceae bacterium]
MTYIELLSPARNLECGIAAVDHGADAVYIGAAKYGARASAGNSVQDIAKLCTYAHRYKVKVYVTVNTILYDHELQDTQDLVWELYRIGADALIVQDLALLRLDLPPIPLHASTQMDNRSPEQAVVLRELGYRQIVLARELSLQQIREIHQAVPDVPLEAFVHGALCVSYSGRCYASEYCFKRSANRGECAQFCRLPFTLKDSNGEIIVEDKFLLSLRDMNRSRHLEEMMDAGVCSFKIEGRLKNVSYVKNITAFYRQQIDAVLRRRSEYKRASLGEEEFFFTPDPARSFSRGFTNYFLHGRTDDLASPDTPKSRGQLVGHVKEVRNGSIIVAGIVPFCNGDGLCFLDAQGQLQGFRVNRVEGNHLFPAEMPDIRKGDVLWRNYDQQWEKLMARDTAVRRIPVSFELCEVEDGFELKAFVPGKNDCSKFKVQRSMTFKAEHQLAHTDQTPGIIELLSKLGDTIYYAKDVEIHFSQPWFIPRSMLADWRRSLVEQLMESAEDEYSTDVSPVNMSSKVFASASRFNYNISNRLSQQFVADTSGSQPINALEVTGRLQEGQALMTCRFCLRYQMGWCPKYHRVKETYKEPYYLCSKDGRRFRLEFDCRNCEMKVFNA